MRTLFLWMPLVVGVVTVFSAIGLGRGRSNGAASYLVGMDRQPDGTYAVYRSDLHSEPAPVRAVVRITNTIAPSNGWSGVGGDCWTRMHWSIDIESAAPLTPADRREIAALAFSFTQQRAPAGAAVVPPPGTNTVSGDETSVNYVGAALWLLTGLPGFLVLVWLGLGLAVWLTRADGRSGLVCDRCGYARSGLAARAVCPECGNAPGFH